MANMAHLFHGGSGGGLHIFVALQIGHQNLTPSKQGVLHAAVKCRVPECNERDILMVSHLLMPGKWRGTLAFSNSWQNKGPTWGKWLCLGFLPDTRGRQEGELSDIFLTVQSPEWCDVWQHSPARGQQLVYFLFPLRVYGCAHPAATSADGSKAESIVSMWFYRIEEQQRSLHCCLAGSLLFLRDNGSNSTT